MRKFDSGATAQYNAPGVKGYEDCSANAYPPIRFARMAIPPNARDKHTSAEPL